jgi:hypothetical protein
MISFCRFVIGSNYFILFALNSPDEGSKKIRRCVTKENVATLIDRRVGNVEAYAMIARKKNLLDISDLLLYFSDKCLPRAVAKFRCALP